MDIDFWSFWISLGTILGLISSQFAWNDWRAWVLIVAIGFFADAGINIAVHKRMDDLHEAMENLHVVVPPEGMGSVPVYPEYPGDDLCPCSEIDSEDVEA